MTTGKKLRVAIAGQWEEVNSFSVETMGLATITGNLATGLQKFEGQEQFQSTAMQIGGYIDALNEVSAEIVPAVYYIYAGPSLEGKAYQQMKQEIVVVKSANHFRAWWTDVASTIIDCDPPGIASNDLSTFAFAKKTQKVYPLDADALYPEAGS